MLAELLSEIPLETLLARASDCAIGAYLQQLARWAGTPHGYARLLLALGRSFQAQPLPEGFHAGKMRQCFANAGMLALERPELTYVEGLGDCGLLPVAHAWCVDQAGRVIDPTWSNCAQAVYFGIPVQRQALHEHLDETGYWGLFDGTLPRRLLDARLSEFLHPDWTSLETMQMLPQGFAG